MSPIEKLRAKLKAAEIAEKWFQEHHQLLQPVVAEAERLGGDADITYDGGLTTHDVTVRLTGDKHVLAAMVRALRTRGFTTMEDPPKANDSSWSSFWSHPGIRDLSWSVYLSFSSSVCRRVKVGTRVVPQHEEDVFEVVCGEQTLDRSAGAEA